MKELKISVEIDADGRIVAQAEGFSGDTCLRELERLLGGLGEWENVERTNAPAERPAAAARRVVIRDNRS